MTIPRSILVIMLRRIGDVLLTTPAVRALRRAHPRAFLDLLVEPPAEEVLTGNPHIRRVLVYRRAKGYARAASDYLRWIGAVRKERYDWVIDYMGNPRSAMITALSGAAVRAGPAHASHRWAYSHPLAQSTQACYAGLEKLRVLRALGVGSDETDYLPEMTLPTDALRRARAALAGLGWDADAPLVGLVPASRRATRRWPARAFAELGGRLRVRCGARLLVFRGPGEEHLAQEVVRGIGDGAASPPTETLRDLAALMRLCRLVVANCSGPRHIATACGVPTLTVHGSSDPACWNPPGDPRHQVARLDDLSCIGCRSNECPYDLECMNGLSPERVARQALEMLGAAAQTERAGA